MKWSSFIRFHDWWFIYTFSWHNAKGSIDYRRVLFIFNCARCSIFIRKEAPLDWKTLVGNRIGIVHLLVHNWYSVFVAQVASSTCAHEFQWQDNTNRYDSISGHHHLLNAKIHQRCNRCQPIYGRNGWTPGKSIFSKIDTGTVSWPLMSTRKNLKF